MGNISRLERIENLREEVRRLKSINNSFRMKLRYSELRLEKFKEKHNNDMAEKNLRYNRILYRWRQENHMKKALSRGKTKYQTLYRELKKQVDCFDWNDDKDKMASRDRDVEVICRAILSYHKLQRDGITEYMEMVILMTADRMRAFNLDVIADRVGSLKMVKPAMHKLTEAGYICKMQRRALWYITVEGRHRLNAIIQHIYNEKSVIRRIALPSKIREDIDKK